MARPTTSVGDLEYEKFDSDGSIKVTEQSPVNYTQFQNEQLLLLKTIIKNQETQINLLKLFSEGDELDDSDSLGWDNTL